MSELQSNYCLRRMKRGVISLMLFSSLVAGCGTLSTLGSYGSYSKCVESCKQEKDERSRLKCEDRCYSKFDWSKSPVLDHMQNADEPKPLFP